MLDLTPPSIFRYQSLHPTSAFIQKNEMASVTLYNILEWLSTTGKTTKLSLVSLFLLLACYRASKKPSRTLTIPKVGERVLILGASSGVGRTMARQYAERGAWVCVVGRREALLLEAEQECRRAQIAHGVESGKHTILAIPADFSNAEDMVSVRETIEASTLSVSSFTARYSVIFLCRLERPGHARCRSRSVCAAATACHRRC